MPFWFWRIVYLMISGIVAWQVNPATFGISFLTDNIVLNIATRGIIFLMVLNVLSKFNKPKKEN